MLSGFAAGTRGFKIDPELQESDDVTEARRTWSGSDTAGTETTSGTEDEEDDSDGVDQQRDLGSTPGVLSCPVLEIRGRKSRELSISLLRPARPGGLSQPMRTGECGRWV